jgi:hypothetical protein
MTFLPRSLPLGFVFNPDPLRRRIGGPGIDHAPAPVHVVHKEEAAGVEVLLDHQQRGGIPLVIDVAER